VCEILNENSGAKGLINPTVSEIAVNSCTNFQFLELEREKWSHAPVALLPGKGHWVSIIRWMGVGPSTGVFVVVLKDKTAIFQESLLCNVCTNKSYFTTVFSFSRPIWLGVSGRIYCHRTQQTGCVLWMLCCFSFG
jgi:hypothetical protein